MMHGGWRMADGESSVDVGVDVGKYGRKDVGKDVGIAVRAFIPNTRS
jgi:hypothetical protein